MTHDTLPGPDVASGPAPGPGPEPGGRPDADRAPGLVRAAGLVGRSLLVLGGLVVAFLVFQLWGTGVHEHRAQRDLAAQLERAISAGQEPAGPLAAPADAPVAPGAPADAPVALGVAARTPPRSADPVGRITAPTIGLDKIVVEGVGRAQLREGPGHYPVTPLPGHAGNVAIAGHRTTHGAPFADIDRLQPGDPIVLHTVDGRFVYRVEAHTDPADGTVSGHVVVAPGDADVIAATGENRLTLTTCHPRYSDRQRLVVTATLEGDPVVFVQPPPSPAGPAADVPAIIGDGAGGVPPAGGPEPFGWHWDELDEVLMWAAFTAAATVPALVLRRHGTRARFVAPALIVAAIPLLVLFSHLDILLPTG
ncbi:MAG: class E sortase [Acidimicrobiales bacterium]